MLNEWDSPSGMSWSPGSNWLAYSLSDLNFNEEVYLHKADNSIDTINISNHPKADRSQVWSDDGSKIGFSSNPNNSDYDAWFVWLKIEDWQKTKEDWEEADDKEASPTMSINSNYYLIHLQNTFSSCLCSWLLFRPDTYIGSDP